MYQLIVRFTFFFVRPHRNLERYSRNQVNSANKVTQLRSTRCLSNIDFLCGVDLYGASSFNRLIMVCLDSMKMLSTWLFFWLLFTSIMQVLMNIILNTTASKAQQRSIVGQALLMASGTLQMFHNYAEFSDNSRRQAMNTLHTQKQFYWHHSHITYTLKGSLRMSPLV